MYAYIDIDVCMYVLVCMYVMYERTNTNTSNLMAKEDFKDLGFEEQDDNNAQTLQTTTHEASKPKY